MKNEIDKSLWWDTAHQKSNPAVVTMTHAVLFKRTGELLLVLNKEEIFPSGIKKQKGWGVVTGKVEDKTPFQTIQKEIFQEAGIPTSAIRLEEDPISVYVDQNGKLHVVFSGTIREDFEMPEVIEDPLGDILEKRLILPSEISMEFRPPKLDRSDVYITHIFMICAARKVKSLQELC